MRDHIYCRNILDRHGKPIRMIRLQEFPRDVGSAGVLFARASHEGVRYDVYSANCGADCACAGWAVPEGTEPTRADYKNMIGGEDYHDV